VANGPPSATFPPWLKPLVTPVVGNRGLSGPALFFVCYYIHRSKNAHFISQAYPTVDDVTSTLSDLWPCSPEPLVFPRTPLPVLSFPSLLHCQSVSRFCLKVETCQCPWAKVFCRSGRIIRLSSSAERAILLTCSVKTSWWWLRITFIGLSCCLPENKQFL